MRNFLKYAIPTIVLGLGISAAASAATSTAPCAAVNPNCKPATAPEIDPSLAIAGISFLAGTLMVVRVRHRK